MITYRKPREVLGEYLAKNYRDYRWGDLYNEDQKEYWYKEADELIRFIKKNPLLKGMTF